MSLWTFRCRTFLLRSFLSRLLKLQPQTPGYFTVGHLPQAMHSLWILHCRLFTGGHFTARTFHWWIFFTTDIPLRIFHCVHFAAGHFTAYFSLRTFHRWTYNLLRNFSGRYFIAVHFTARRPLTVDSILLRSFHRGTFSANLSLWILQCRLFTGGHFTARTFHCWTFYHGHSTADISLRSLHFAAGHFTAYFSLRTFHWWTFYCVILAAAISLRYILPQTIES